MEERRRKETKRTEKDEGKKQNISTLERS
jgi:hypothetical protein